MLNETETNLKSYYFCSQCTELYNYCAGLKIMVHHNHEWHACMHLDNNLLEQIPIQALK